MKLCSTKHVLRNKNSGAKIFVYKTKNGGDSVSQSLVACSSIDWQLAEEYVRNGTQA